VLGYKVTMAFTLVTLFSLPIADVEAYLWLRRGRRGWASRFAFIAYSIGLAIIIAWKINEIYSFWFLFFSNQITLLLLLQLLLWFRSCPLCHP